MSETETVPGPSGRIAYDRRGSGHPVVLMHPLALSGQVWDPLAGKLAEDFDVITPDARGHGASGWDGRPFDMKDLADDVTALLDSLGLRSVHLLGLSMGGSAAMTFAGMHPDRVDRLLVADTTAWYGPDAVEVWATRADRALSTPRPRQVPFQVDRWFTEPFRATHPDQVRRVVNLFLDTDSAAHAEASYAMGRLDARDLLSHITAPTLALTGSEDYATPPEMGNLVAENVVDGRALTLAGLRHLSLIEQPELADLVLAHLHGRDLPDAPAAATCGCQAGTSGRPEVSA